ncbi:MAG: SDR family oxidoreductase [Gammaproteobacteria bacterium]|nr:MAG: SDR family oxidoreductase [Gammaproteobacteria bacterium]
MTFKTKDFSIPVWGGIECTVHRLGNNFGDQLQRNGHEARVSDLKLIAELGIKTLRYPIIWERVAPHGIAKADWSWVDERLGLLKDLGINPIAGLLHHGSGPEYTSLIDPDFPQKFTEFAVAVAERYPWLEIFTPINEPLTTARFSCLYGLWYPHLKDDRAFSTAVLNECKATILAMREIKKIIPNAKLLQTEDLGKCHGTKKMQYQCDFENERRWVSLDILAGKLDDNTTMCNFFRKFGGIKQATLDFFSDNYYPPDIIGINHYITSERFLDEDRKKYPHWSYAQNGKHTYADVDILRADIHKRDGHYKILKSVAARYNLPIAITEVHLGSSREAQLRWFMEAYDACSILKEEGVDIRAITAWSLLGAYDWNSLLTQDNNFYESGAFDVRAGKPRPTAVAKLIQQLCEKKSPNHPVLQAEGWWKNTEHVHFAFGESKNARTLPVIEQMFPENLANENVRPVFIIGATGTLGRAFAHICSMRNISYLLLSRKEMDIVNEEQVEALFREHEPWAVINAAGFVRVDDAESMADLCFRENTCGPVVLARACLKFGARLLTFSSDLVFDGKTKNPYCETSVTAPLNMYGTSKAYAEKYVLAENPTTLVVRTSAFFGPWDNYNFLAQMKKSLLNEKPFLVSNDQTITPTYIPDLVNNCLDLLIDQAEGIWHLTNATTVTWSEFAMHAANVARLDKKLIVPVATKALGLRATRPSYSALKSEKGILLPELSDATSRFFEHLPYEKNSRAPSGDFYEDYHQKKSRAV